jgi:hypothetical protein
VEAVVPDCIDPSGAFVADDGKPFHPVIRGQRQSYAASKTTIIRQEARP